MSDGAEGQNRTADTVILRLPAGVTRRFRRLAAPDRLLRVAFWAVLLAVIAFTRADPDLWGHVRAGMDAIRDGRLERTDPYSFTSDRPWINHEWAAEVAAGAAYELLGNMGLVLVKIAVVGGVLLILRGALRRQHVGDPRIRDYLCGLAVITTIQQTHHVRPQVFSLLFFALLLVSLNAAERGNRRGLLGLPLLFAVWSNFHGGWIVGGVLAFWTACVALKAPARVTPWYVGAGVASLLATLANPYGIGLWRFLQTTVAIGRADITDWQPVYALGPDVWALWIMTATLAGAGLFRYRRMKPALERVVVILALAALSFRVNRLLGFFALATLLLLGEALALTFKRRTAPAEAPPRVAAAVGIVVAAALTIGAVLLTASNVACVQIDPRMTPPAGAVDFLKSRSGRLLVWFDWGEYALWHLFPAFRVSIDGRRETVYSAALQDRHLRFFFDVPGGASLPDEINADHVWIPMHLPAAGRLRAMGWTAVYADAVSVVFARRAGSQSVASTRGARHTQARCFPGP